MSLTKQLYRLTALWW